MAKDSDKLHMNPPQGEFLVYTAEDGQVKLEVRLEDENLWLTQQLMTKLFETTKQNISLHIQNIYEEGELSPEATVKEYLTVRSEGNRQGSKWTFCFLKCSEKLGIFYVALSGRVCWGVGDTRGFAPGWYVLAPWVF